MVGDVSLELWINGHQLKALKRRLKESGTDIETVMQEKLMELYRQTVPHDERLVISDIMAREQAEFDAISNASRRFAVFHVTEHGKSEYFLHEQGYQLPTAAIAVRSYLRDELCQPLPSFSTLFPGDSHISAEVYEEYLAERMENTGRVTNAYNIDFDRGEFSTLEVEEGWLTYSINDVVAAAYHASRNPNIFTDQRLVIMRDKLAGKEIATPEHLVNSEIPLGDENAEMDNQVGMEMSQ